MGSNDYTEYDTHIRYQPIRQSELDRLRSINAELLEALDPFKRLAAMLEPLGLSDNTPIRDCAPGVWPTLGDCRKARTVSSKAT